MRFFNNDINKAISMFKSGKYKIYDNAGNRVVSELQLYANIGKLSKFIARKTGATSLKSSVTTNSAKQQVCDVCGYNMITAKIMTGEPILYCENCKNTEHIKDANNKLSSKTIGTEKKIVTLDISKGIPEVI